MQTAEKDRPFDRPSVSLAVLWHNFGPYHVARLRAAQEAAEKSGRRLVAVELGRRCPGYRWDEVRGNERFEKITLFDTTAIESENPAAVVRSVDKALDHVRPQSVAIPGWSNSFALSALLWCRRNNRAAILMSASKAGDKTRRTMREWGKRRIVGLFDSAVVGGASQRRYVRQLGLPAEAIFDGYDVIDNTRFAQGAEAARRNAERLRAEFDLPEDYFLVVCRLVAIKNLDRLIEAYRRYLRHAGPQAWSLVIVGDGPCRQRLEAAAEPVAGKVRFAGFRQIDALPVYYGLARALILPSLNETWGLVVNEAMAAGLPVLVSETAGVRHDLVRDGLTGWAFDPTSTESITDALLALGSLPDERLEAMGEAAGRLVGQWGPERFATSLNCAVDLGRRRRTGGQCLSDEIGRWLATCLARSRRPKEATS